MQTLAVGHAYTRRPGAYPVLRSERYLQVGELARAGGDGLGISLAPESWQTDILTLEPGTQGMLGALVDDTLRKLNP